MQCADDSLEVLTGRNQWVLARTDRDAPSRDDVIQTAAAFMRTQLGPASPLGSRSVFEAFSSPGGDGRYFIGAARPVTLQAFQATTPSEALAAIPRLDGRTLARHTDCGILRGVNAQNPWFVVAEFDWRAPDVLIPWPRRAVNLLGFPTTDSDPTRLDWLALGAAHRGAAEERDSSFTEEVGEEAADAARKVFRSAVPIVATAAGVGLLMWIASKQRKGSFG